MARSRYVYRRGYKRLLAACFDAVTSLLSPLFRASPSGSPRKILIIRLDHLGDVLLSRAAIRSLRRAYPSAKIDLLLDQHYAPLMRLDPAVDRVLPVAGHWFSRASRKRGFGIFMEVLRMVKAESYDLGVDFRGDARHILLMFFAKVKRRVGYGITGGGPLLTDCPEYPWGKHQVEVNQMLLETLNIHETPVIEPFSVSEAQKAPREDALQIPGEGVTVCVHPGAGAEEKKWPGESYRALIQMILSKRPAAILIIGTQEERDSLPLGVPDSFSGGALIDLRGQTSVESLPALLKQVQLFIGNDSGPAHVAAAQGVPVLCLFSLINDPAVWRPWGTRVKVIAGEMSALSVDHVFSEVCALLDQPSEEG